MAENRAARLSPEQYIRQLKSEKDYRGQLIFAKLIPARPATYAALTRPVHPSLTRALRAIGVVRFYSHQAQAIQHALDGQHIAITTGTASGKTLCYNVPVLDRILREPATRGLYLFPTKALAQDQLRALGAFQNALPPASLAFGAYDGDTPATDRQLIRQDAHIILTNPDMLSLGILPNHRLWERFLRNLRYIVLDEAHAYRGIFGSHVAVVIRRLRRLCAHYGSQPQVILCSATIANPSEHAHNLCGNDVKLVADDGSPRGRRWFAIWNPIPEEGGGRPTTSDAARLLGSLVSAGLRTIAFAMSRRTTELILAEARRRLERTAPRLTSRLGVYRAGYQPATRRAVEKGLFEGDLLGVAATNALELGIDIGDLDATILVGYPGTAASLWQQAGRAGRGTGDALTVLVAGDDPVNQYFARHPDALLQQTSERALTSPGNPYILEKQLPCAASELPLGHRDEALFGDGYVDAMVKLENSGTLLYQNDRWLYRGTPGPARRLSLRSVNRHDVKLVHESDQRLVIEEIDASSARFRVHEGAIYLHQGEPYLVTRFDARGGLALARRVASTYFTEPRTVVQLNIAQSLLTRPIGSTQAYLGHVRISERLVGYRRRQRGREAAAVDIALESAPVYLETVAVWWDLPARALSAVHGAGRQIADSVHAVEHLCSALLPLYAMCDRQDVGGYSSDRHAITGKPRIFLFDQIPAGMGISETGYARLESLWHAALDVVEKCPCRDGCPACVQSAQCRTGGDRLDKQGAILLLRQLVKSK